MAGGHGRRTKRRVARRSESPGDTGAGSCCWLLLASPCSHSPLKDARQEIVATEQLSETASEDLASSDTASPLPTSAEDGEPSTDDTSAEPANAAAGAEAIHSSDLVQRTALRLPPSLPDGRPLRPIALFMSQMDELIPDDYRPISIDQLNEAITRLTDRATDDKASRLKSAVYWVEVEDDTLVSNRSVIDIESDRPTEVRRSLGKVNLALEPPLGRIDGSLTQYDPKT